MVDLPSRLLTSPKVGLGVATAALVALATGGTTLLVSHGTRDLQPPAPVVAAPQPSPPGRAPVVVPRAPGSIALPPAHLVVPPVPAPPAAVPAVAAPVEHTPRGPVVPPVPAVPAPVVEPPVVQPPVLSPALQGHGRHGNKGKHLGQLKH